MTAIPIGLRAWAARWQVSPECLFDLLATMLPASVPNPTPVNPDAPTPVIEKSEAYAQSLVRLEAPRYGVWLTRNNVGALKDIRGVPVRYGLANESKEQNKVLKSGDLIGIRPVTIQPQHVGTVLGQFVSRECKRPGWTFKGDAHERAQLNWLQLINRYGGDAKFVTGEGSFT